MIKTILVHKVNYDSVVSVRRALNSKHFYKKAFVLRLCSEKLKKIYFNAVSSGVSSVLHLGFSHFSILINHLLTEIRKIAGRALDHFLEL